MGEKQIASPGRIAELITSGDLRSAYAELAKVYEFFLSLGQEAPGVYKAIHLVALFWEMERENPRHALTNPHPRHKGKWSDEK